MFVIIIDASYIDFFVNSAKRMIVTNITNKTIHTLSTKTIMMNNNNS